MDFGPESAFQRLVQQRKGSYCFGQNTVLLGMLRGLGYRYEIHFTTLNLSDVS